MTENGRREQRKQDTRRALEDAALRRFADAGYDETSVEEIAADAGVSARTFFRYFATKDEVLEMGREERQGELRSRIRGLAVSADYRPPFAFTGELDRVELRSGAPAARPESSTAIRAVVAGD